MKIRKKTKILIIAPIILVLGYLGFNTKQGSTFVIETNEPAEDFVVLCTKRTRKLIGHNSTHSSKITKVIVTKSGVEQSCGLLIGGEPGVLRVMHPTLVGNGKKHYVKNGVLHRVYDKTKLDVLDEQKAKFEAGYWDKAMNPGFEYANSVGNCGLSFSYLDQYSQVKQVDKEHFRKLYNASIVECLTRVYKIYKKYRPKSSEQYTDGETRMKKFWSSDKWEKYE